MDVPRGRFGSRLKPDFTRNEEAGEPPASRHVASPSAIYFQSGSPAPSLMLSFQVFCTSSTTGFGIGT
ncbi:MAG: hypothetical protein JWR16_2293 [Nevskia sp.]|nr:hypothetical protein [Nevskia sp.]